MSVFDAFIFRVKNRFNKSDALFHSFNLRAESPTQHNNETLKLFTFHGDEKFVNRGEKKELRADFQFTQLSVNI